MKEIKEIVCENLVNFRKSNKLTQLELAEKVGYSDKAVSRWEKGEVTPDVETLDRLAKIYNLPISAFFEENANPVSERKNKLQIGNKLTIALLSIVTVWFVITVIYIYARIIARQNPWQIFVLGAPISFALAIFFNFFWGSRIYGFIYFSALIWSLIAYFYLSWLEYNMWIIFFIGLPLQIAIVLMANLKTSPKKKKSGSEKKILGE
ncbi:MAG: helix-turn-helix domain-containing protein [Clostridia bacterium]|nr:helix-turn-helix domain-containing protein [Clostridia bacterium]